MKAILVICATLIFSFNAISDYSHSPHKYCAELKDGIMTVTHEGKVLTSNVILTNGVVIKSDGTVQMKDGNIMLLKNGECVDQDGMVMNNKEDIKDSAEPKK